MVCGIGCSMLGQKHMRSGMRGPLTLMLPASLNSGYEACSILALIVRHSDILIGG